MRAKEERVCVLRAELFLDKLRPQHTRRAKLCSTGAAHNSKDNPKASDFQLASADLPADGGA